MSTEPTAVFPALATAHTALLEVASRVTADQLGLPTPCAQWSVAQVLQHAAGDQRAYAQALTGQDGPSADPFEPSGVLDGAPSALVAPAVEVSARAFSAVDPAGEIPTPLPHGELPSSTAAGAAALDAVVHAWDLAVATGQPSPLDDELSAEILAVARQIVEPLRQWGAYAAIVPADPASPSSPTDDLLRYLGRDPRWIR